MKRLPWRRDASTVAPADVDWNDLELLQDHVGDFIPNYDTNPEPATLSLLALGGLAVIRRRRGA